MTPKLYKAAEVCEMAQLQPYVLRSWEKEFPGIGVQKSDDSPRFYRQSDVDHVLRIKQLVFGDGLTLSGARRKLEESAPAAARRADEAAEAIEVLGADARTRIAHVRDGLRSLLRMLSNGNGDGYALTPPPRRAPPARAKARPVAARKTTPTRKSAPTRGKSTARDSRGKNASKRKRASA